RGYRLAIDRHRDPPKPLHLTGQKTVEDERKVVRQLFNFLVYDFVRSCTDSAFQQAVKLTPDDDGSLAAEPFHKRQFRNVFLIEHGQDPVVPLIDDVEVPLGTTRSATLATCYGQ